ncbi:hypothetical protein D3C78_1610340 [compost metagenome]
MGSEERALDVDVQAQVQVRLGKLVNEFAIAIDTGVIDHDVDAPESTGSGVDEGCQVFATGHIATLVKRLAATRDNQLGSSQFRLFVEAVRIAGLLNVTNHQT